MPAWSRDLEEKVIEKRRARRRRVLKTGTIAFAHGAAIDCLLRNYSPTGACLAIESPIGIPDRFTLIVKSDDAKHACEVVWRSATQVGVRFIPM